jgi:hypothetical protein
MLSIPGRVKIFLAVEPTDMRQGFDRLADERQSRSQPLSIDKVRPTMRGAGGRRGSRLAAAVSRLRGAIAEEVEPC